jgi:hypothetical protein
MATSASTTTIIRLLKCLSDFPKFHFIPQQDNNAEMEDDSMYEGNNTLYDWAETVPSGLTQDRHASSVQANPRIILQYLQYTKTKVVSVYAISILLGSPSVHENVTVMTCCADTFSHNSLFYFHLSFNNHKKLERNNSLGIN